MPQNHDGIVNYGCVELIELDESFRNVCAMFFDTFDFVNRDP